MYCTPNHAYCYAVVRDDAERQVRGYSNTLYEAACTWAAALELWAAHCDNNHNHSATLPPTPTPSPKKQAGSLATVPPASLQAGSQRAVFPTSPSVPQTPRKVVVLSGTPAASPSQGGILDNPLNSPFVTPPRGTGSRRGGPATPFSTPSKGGRFYAMSGSPIIYRDR